jgi:AcrR family transcriptional regulator
VPGKVRFTSGPGRQRRQQLLQAARDLLQEREPNEVSFADVCARAKIPRPSAYHFFPSIQAVFVGLRMLQAEELVRAIGNAEMAGEDTWTEYFRRLVDRGADVLRQDTAGTKLIYGILDGYSEARQLGQDVDARLAEVALTLFERRFQIPMWEGRDRCFAIAFAIVDAIFKLSYRRAGWITDAMIEEAKRAAVSYLRNYLPEYLPVQPNR